MKILRVIAWIVLMFLLLVLERACSLYGVFFVATIFLLYISGEDWTAQCCIFGAALCADLLFLRPFGVTGVMIGLSLGVWVVVQKWSRWRFFIYGLLGCITSIGLASVDARRFVFDLNQVLHTCVVLIVGWMILRALPPSTHQKHR